MNILLVSEYYPPLVMGGGEINLSLLASALARQGHRVHLLTSRWKALPSVEEQGNLTIHRKLTTGSNPASPWSNLTRSIQLEPSIIKEVISLTHTETIDLIHFIGISIMAAPHLKQLKKPLFATIESYPALCPKGDRLYHGTTACTISCTFLNFISCQHDSPEIGKMNNKFYLQQNPLFWAYAYHRYSRLKNALSYCHLLAISTYVQKLLEQEGHQSTVIPNTLDLAPFLKNPPSEKKKKKNQKLKILYLGALLTSKGPQFIVEALKRLEPDFQCDFYGEGPLKEKLLENIRRHEVDAKIHAPVPYSEIPLLYQQADIVIFPSLWPEPFGRIALEAVAAGKFIIASKVGGIEETLQSHPALLVQPGKTEELRRALQQAAAILNVPEKKRQKQKPAAHLQKLQEEYSPEHLAARQVAAYQQVLKNR